MLIFCKNITDNSKHGAITEVTDMVSYMCNGYLPGIAILEIAKNIYELIKKVRYPIKSIRRTHIIVFKMLLIVFLYVYMLILGKNIR